jgi:hypothetical protein
MSPLDRLAHTAAQIAMQAAADYIRAHNLTPDLDRLVEALRRAVKLRLFEAMDDARAALDAHMDALAEATFAASMRLAGIEAAKEAKK